MMMRLIIGATALSTGALAALAPALAQTAPASQPVASSWPVVADTSGTNNTAPAPGDVVVRLNGRLRFYAGYFDDSTLNRDATSSTSTLVPETVTINGVPTSVETVKTTTSVSRNKQDNYGLIEYLRLYPALDGVTAGGLKYGATAEIRQDNTSAPGGGLAGSVSGANPSRGELYVRREWGYIGTAELGTLRFGAQDTASSLMQTGVLENFNDGGWNGDVRYGLATQAQLRWPFPDDGSVYTTNKVVYLSPSLYGFDLGASFEPSTAGDNIDDGNCAVASASNTIGTSPIIVTAPLANVAGCDRLDSTTSAIESARRRNTADVTLRYRYAFDNGVAIAATATYTGGSHVSYTGPADTASGKKFVQAVTYQGLSIGDFGAAITYAGFLVGANYEFGRFNNALASGSSQTFTPAPVGAKQANAWTAGAQYTFGPAIIGASWVSTDSEGAYSYSAGATPALSALTGVLGQRHEDGLNAGGTLKIAPGLGVFLTYLYDDRRQAGYDFVDSAIVAGTSDPTLHNAIRAQALTLGTSINW